MATSVLSICNMAIARIGVSKLISSLNEPSNEARMCSLFYEQMRDYALREYPWNFAEKRVVLANAGIPPQGYGYKYAYPSDCLKALRITNPSTRTPRNDQRVHFKVATENGIKVIYTDQAEAELVYTSRIEEPTLFDPMFSSALSYLLASEMAMPLSVQPQIATQARNAYAQVSSAAAAASMGEGAEEPAPESELTSARF
jgi:hypothetical protein